MNTKRPLSMTGFFIVWTLVTLTCHPCNGDSLSGGQGSSFYTEASYYTVASCLKESGQYRMANGRLLDDSKTTAASWDWPLGTRIKVKCGDREVVLPITDRGPSKRLYRAGRRLDVSFKAAQILGFVRKGLAQVTVEVVK